MAKERTEEVRRWVTLSTELAAKEKELKASLSPRIAEVLKDKRLCLLETRLTDAGHEDPGLVDDIKKGFDLTGPQGHCRDEEFSLRSFVRPA